MPSFVYERGSELIVKNDLDPETATIKARLCMSNTTCDTEKDKLTLSGFTDIDAHGTATDQTIANITVNTIAGNKTVIDGDNINFASLAAGARGSVGLLIYQDLGGAANDVPLVWLEFPSEETHVGDDFPVNFNATNGIFYLQQ